MPSLPTSCLVFGSAFVAATLVWSPCRAEDRRVAPELQAAADSLAVEHRVCAVAYAAISARSVSTSGVASGCDPAQPLTPDSVFQAASLAKPVVAYGVLKLVQRGLLDLEAPVLKYLPRGYVRRKNPFDNRLPALTELVDAPELMEVTLRMALNHTSGLPNWSTERLAFDFSPGKSWQYSGEGFMLLQRVVETVAGVPLDEFMRREVFDPIGMASSELRWSATVAGKLMEGTSLSGQKRQLRFPEPIAAASLYTTANDYARFVARLLNDSWAMNLTTEKPATAHRRLGLQWGLGWGIEPGPQGPNLWQWGSNPGYRAFVMASASSGDAIVILTNSERGMALAEPLTKIVLPGEHNAFGFPMLR
jgi:CubicO group peptidase (beta-lactamase class C family)